MDIGNTLRDARQRRGISVQEISRVTKISVHVLEDMERKETDVLAGEPFMRAHLRAYASQVGLNPAQIVGEFRPAHEEFEIEALRDLRMPVLRESSSRHAGTQSPFVSIDQQ